MQNEPKVAIVHYWLISQRGGERIVELLLKMYPNADIYTNVISKEYQNLKVSSKKINTTFVNSLPFAEKLYRYYLPLMPMALENLDLSSYDLIISHESGPAKFVLPGIGTTHVCYVSSTMRYIWDMYNPYRKSKSKLFRFLWSFASHYLRIVDRQSFKSVDKIVANSEFISSRIKRYHGCQVDKVIQPAPNFEKFETDSISISSFNSNNNFYLYFGEVTDYKNPQLAVSAFENTERTLVVAGTGDQFDELNSIGHPNIHFLGRISDGKVKWLFENAKALIFPGVEDFGIIPLEAMFHGLPVIALNKGGAKETVIPEMTGVLFDEDTKESLTQAIEYFEKSFHSFDKEVISNHAKLFSEERFIKEFKQIVERALIDAKNNH